MHKEKQFSNPTLEVTLVLITTGTILINKRQNYNKNQLRPFILAHKKICPNTS